ncbi:MAG: hypothetical protein M3Y54_13720 [Bacteroidota bacterium]|nr:hypothetical protein [Bacteroidota bacterium]
MSTLTRFSVLAFVGTASLSSCAVYKPTIPCTPLVTQAGQVEIATSLQLASSLEASVAWSPVSHLIVLGEAGYDCGGNTHAKAGFGIGGYQLVGKDKTLYLGAIGGIGSATVDVKGVTGSYFNAAYPSISADYTNYYGQLYAAHLGRVSFGGALRTTFVNYQNVVQDGQPVETQTRFFLEPCVFVRFGRGPVQFQGTIGGSEPVMQANQKLDGSSNLEDQLFPQSRIFGVGLVIRPHLFTKHQ